MEILNTHNVCKSFGEHQALKNVSLSISKQRIFGLLGPNGAGKTTLIRIINQIIEADSGEIEINGERLAPHHIETIGYLPEERGLYKKMKVGEQLIFFARLKGMSRSKALETCKHWVKKFEIADWWNKNVEDLSKGMGQKIQFIATVLHRPKLLILDEPFSGFDPINANLIKDEILQLREEGSTIIFSTHRMESVEELCDDIALINKAEKILDGTKEDIKKTFQSNLYTIKHFGDISSLSSGFELVQKNTIEENLFETEIRLSNGNNPNKLLQELINQTEVHSFKEVIPSINDIFIAKVKEGNNE